MKTNFLHVNNFLKLDEKIHFEDEDLNMKFTQSKSFIANKARGLMDGKIEIEFARV